MLTQRNQPYLQKIYILLIAATEAGGAKVWWVVTSAKRFLWCINGHFLHQFKEKMV